MSDPLFDAICAAPDDDAPRLVWADREGGERGELVVVQCALARGDLDDGARQRLAEREAELLKRSESWIGPIPYASARFVRGFVEVIELVEVQGRNLAALLERHPLVRTVVVPCFASVQYYEEVAPAKEVAFTGFVDSFAAAPPGRVRSLELHPCIEELDYIASDAAYTLHRYGDELVALLPTLPSLADLDTLALRTGAFTAACIPPLARLPKLSTLHVGDERLGGAGCAELVRALPALRELHLEGFGLPRMRGSELTTLLACAELGRLEVFALDPFPEELTPEEQNEVRTKLPHTKVLVAPRARR